MKTGFNLFIYLLFINACLFSQTNSETSNAIRTNDFSGTLSFLSSDWMEGREAGEKGSFIASDYIASMMELAGLKPYNTKRFLSQSYFHTFDIIRYKLDDASLSFITQNGSSRSSLLLTNPIDFIVETGYKNLEGEAPLVFAGYGISEPEKGYDDYKNLDVRGCIVVVMEGFPGHHDSHSEAYKNLMKSTTFEYEVTDTKLLTAYKKGALAMIEFMPERGFEPNKYSQINRAFLQSDMNSEKDAEPEYEDYDYALPGDSCLIPIPCFKLGKEATDELFKETEINFAEVENKAANKLVSTTFTLKNMNAGFSIHVRCESLLVRNVIGMIPGKDNHKCIVIGAHYDHLGKRNGQIYNGADDNASGCAGMLALAAKWSRSSEPPPCNLIFGAWTAEEKGLFGSSYYVQHSGLNPENTLLYINLDMISRSAPEDSSKRILSIGTIKGSDKLRSIAEKNNRLLSIPFKLDLWECSGDGGSDYAAFAEKKIPVMTFFSGYNDDYHSPLDIAPKTDLWKMNDILELTNKCLGDFLENIPGK